MSHAAAEHSICICLFNRGHGGPDDWLERQDDRIVVSKQSQRRMELFVCAMVRQAGILEAQEKKAALQTLLTCGTASAVECL